MNSPDARQKIAQLAKLVGNTPLLRIYCAYAGEIVPVFAKYEAWNFSGSIKDRMALQILKNAYNLGTLKPKDTIVEATSGNTGIAFAAMGAFLGHPVEIYMPDWLSEERKQLLRFYGAKLHEISAEEGGFLKCIELAAEKAQKPGVFGPKQFENISNPMAHFYKTAAEADRTFFMAGYRKMDAFVAGVGTGGTVIGFHKYFSERVKHFQTFPVFPVNNSDGGHRIEGIGDSFVPEILSLAKIQEPIRVRDTHAISVARLLNGKGLSVGISSGANVFAAAMKTYELGAAKNVLTVLSDDSRKYLSTDLCSGSKEEIPSGFEILGYDLVS